MKSEKLHPRKKSKLFAPAAILIICLIFFYPIFKGHIPFPGDLLVGNSGPYSSNTYGGFVPGAVPHKAQGPDVIRQLYPWKHFVIESFKNGRVPFWNPYNFSGNPLMANFQSAVFYPFNALFFLMPFNDAWVVFILLIPLLAAFFTYLYLREIEISEVPSIFAGVVFGFSSYMTVWMEYGNIGHTLLWLPLGLYFTEKLAKAFNKQYLFGLIVVCTLSILGGYIQGYFYTAAFLSVYFLFKQFKNKNIVTLQSVLFFGSLVAPIGLTLFQFLPTLDLFRLSSRGNYSLDTISELLNPWWYAISVIAPDFFGHPASRNHWFYGTYIERVSFFGVIPLFFAVFALLNHKKRQEITIFGIVLITTFILAFDLLITKFFYLIPIPVISTTVPTRILSLFVFSGALLSGIGFHYFLQVKEKRKTYMVYACVGLLLTLGWGTVLLAPQLFTGADWVQYTNVSKRNLIIPSLLVISFLIIHIVYAFQKRLVYLFIAVVCLLTFFDLFRFFHKITPFSPKEYVYPETPVISYIQKNAGIYRYWGYGSGAVGTNFQLVDHTYSPDGNDPLHVKMYTEFIETSLDGKVPTSLPRPDADIAPGFGKEDLRNNQYRQKILNVLGVKYILHKSEALGSDLAPDTEIFNPEIYSLVWQQTPWQVYENKAITKRVFLTNDFIIVPDKEKQVVAFFDKRFDEKKTIILEKDPKITKGQLTKKNVHVLSYTPNEVLLKTVSDADSLLFLSDTYYPYWKVRVDGQEREVLVANYSFRAVQVPSGEHRVQFYYASKSFYSGLIFSGIFALALGAAYVFVPANVHKQKKKI